MQHIAVPLTAAVNGPNKQLHKGLLEKSKNKYKKKLSDVTASMNEQKSQFFWSGH